MQRRILVTLIGLALFAGGLVLALYGVFAILYQGDGTVSGDTHVTLLGREVDADLAGAVALAVAALAILVALGFLKWERSPDQRP